MKKQSLIIGGCLMAACALPVLAGQEQLGFSPESEVVETPADGGDQRSTDNARGIVAQRVGGIESISAIDSDKRLIEQLRNQREIAQLRSDIREAQRPEPAGNELVRALEDDLAGRPPRQSSAPASSVGPSERPPALGSRWSVHSISGVGGIYRAVLVNDAGERLVASEGTRLDGAGRVVRIGNNYVRVSEDGDQRALPISRAESGSGVTTITTPGSDPGGAGGL